MSIGNRSDLIRKIKAVVPFAEFPDASCGQIGGDGFSIEINLGKSEQVKEFAFHVRGEDIAAYIVADILAALELRALDCGTGDFFAPKDPAEGIRRWRDYRDEVCGR